MKCQLLTMYKFYPHIRLANRKLILTQVQVYITRHREMLNIDTIQYVRTYVRSEPPYFLLCHDLSVSSKFIFIFLNICLHRLPVVFVIKKSEYVSCQVYATFITILGIVYHFGLNKCLICQLKFCFKQQLQIMMLSQQHSHYTS